MNSHQSAKIEKIETWFKAYFNRSSLARFETRECGETGFIYVSVATDGSELLSRGGLFQVRSRGGVRCMAVHDYDSPFTKSWYDKQLNTKR